jgi:MoaA/NifB/PqqE/SkfB family radical SAM enzyme
MRRPELRRPMLLDRALDRARLRRAPGRPKQVHLSVTDRCFLPCSHCDIWKNDTVDLPTEFWEDAIDRLADWCAPAAMNFVGGEPLLRKDLESLMQRATSRGFEVSFNTNGWLVTEARARAIADAGVSISYVSLDGVKPETVDETRGRKGAFDKAWTAVERLLAAAGPRVVLSCILHAGNADEMGDLVELCRRRGLQLVIQPLYQNFGENEYNPRWYEDAHLFPRSEAELTALDTALDRLTAERLRGGPVCNAPAQLQAMKAHFRTPGEDNGQMCRAGHSDLSLDPHGNVRLCYFLEPVAHLSDPTPLPLIWDSFTALRRRWEVSRCDRHCNLLNCNFS